MKYTEPKINCHMFKEVVATYDNPSSVAQVQAQIQEAASGAARVNIVNKDAVVGAQWD